MKRLKPFILVSLLLAVSAAALACGPFYYSAADNRIYRLLPPGWQAPTSAYDFETCNIMAWSRQTGCCDTAAIRRALYSDWNRFADWETLLDEMTTTATARYNPMTDNGFCRCLVATHDTDAVRLLCWSKAYSNIRNAQRSPWYYNSRVDTDEKRQLRQLYDKVTACKPTRKYADRYKFLAIKCAWALGEDSAVLAMCRQPGLQRKDNLFYYEARDYAARSLTRTGRQKEARAIYAQDLNYAQLIPFDATTPTKLSILLQVCPNSQQVALILQNYLTSLDIEQARTYNWCEDYDAYQTDSVLLVARMAIANPAVRRKAMWRYAAACVLDYKGRQKDALKTLDGAEDGDGDAFLQKSVRTLTFYLRSRTEPVDDSFERYAISEIKWLDGEMQREWGRMADADRRAISDVLNYLWVTELNRLCSSAALRRIVLQDSVGLAWRMVRVGRGVRALQMANVADNHFFEMTDNTCVEKMRQGGGIWDVWYTGDDGDLHYVLLTSLDDTAALGGEDFWFWQYENNSIDYSNGMFCVADVVDASTLAAYRKRQLNPQDDDDRWFNARSYTDGDYWNDIVGTHCLRERNYRAAAAHFSRISPAYQRRMNISCHIDPFGIDRSVASHDSTHYKLRFATRMDSLSKAMHSDPDADRRAMAMLEYTIGLENSFGMCWWLTSYDKGWVGPDLTDIEETHYAHSAAAIVKQLRAEAVRTLTSDEARARYHLRMGHFATVRKRYAHTATGIRLNLECDKREMYMTSKNKRPVNYVVLDDGTAADGDTRQIYRLLTSGWR